ncbi:MAG: DEAD/DEAH box helicase [Magnetococcus sp. WYHC-3]
MSEFSFQVLSEPLRKALERVGYTQPTPIQVQAIPPLLEGRDLLGIAQTGTGKTAAFALPILERLMRTPRRASPRGARVLVLAPTRELASQIDDSFAAYGTAMRLSRAVIFGGVGQTPQVRAMARGVDILTATPGRLLDLMGQGHVALRQLDVLVLDEADRMLDMGFIHDVRRIISQLPTQRQTLLFSATMPPDIASLAAELLSQPVRVEVTPQATTVERIQQQVLFVERSQKRALLHLLLAHDDLSRVLVFTRTKHAANRVAEDLEKGAVSAVAIHGNKSQSARERALEAFRDGAARVLVATDIAARGIDVDGISHVINFDLPNEPESYVHRIGRTARAGRDGSAISFCDSDERLFLRDIERTIRMRIPVRTDHPYHAEATARSSAGEGAAGAASRAAAGARPGRSSHAAARRPPERQAPSAGATRRSPERQAPAAGTETAGRGERRAQRSSEGNRGGSTQPPVRSGSRRSTRSRGAARSSSSSS